MNDKADWLMKTINSFTYKGTSGHNKLIWTEKTRKELASALRKKIEERLPDEIPEVVPSGKLKYATRVFDKLVGHNDCLKKCKQSLGIK